MKKLKMLKRPIIIFLVLAIVISCIICVHNKNTVNAQVNELSDYKNSYEEEMDNFRLDDFKEEYETYIEWLEKSIANNYVKEGIRIRGLLEELKESVIENNEELYNNKYDEINSFDINELEEEIKNNINSQRELIEKCKSENKYKEAIEDLEDLKDTITNSLDDLNKKKEEAIKQQEEEKQQEEQKDESNNSDDQGNNAGRNGKSRGSKRSNSTGGFEDRQDVNEGNYVKNLGVSRNTNQLVIVKGEGGSSATVEFHKKDGNGVWKQVFSTSAYVGQNGITNNKREGDRKTPAGVYGFGTAFGVAQNPGSNVAYKHLNNDDCWVDDSNSSNYNTMCSMSAGDKDWNSCEHMVEYSDAYRYGIVIQYNTYDRVPGKGSGIFLHCKTRPTLGCVAIDSNYMVTLLQQINSSALIVIVASEDDLNNY